MRKRDEQMLRAMVEALVPILPPDARCEVCGDPISVSRIIAAQQRGSIAKYCSTTCRATAAKRRQRAS